MEELRIKCPSCGIILEVRNSKNETVKRITCPNCKKYLAVSFHEEPKPAQYVEIKMVQLADGSQKTIVRALTDDHEVIVNGERLMKDDEVVLTSGDKLEIDGKPHFTPKSDKELAHPPVPVSRIHDSEESAPNELPFPVLVPKRNAWYLFVALITIIVAVFVLWQSFWNHKPEEVKLKPAVDTIAISSYPETGKNKLDKPKLDVKKNDTKLGVQSQISKTSPADMSEYDLERMAIKGDAEAQCQLGKRWVNKGDSINVVKGIKYLKQASSNGSSEAKTALRKVYVTLQQSAANGSTTASNIIREQQ